MDYNLERFKKAQVDSYETALEEIRNGHKESHWMWYVFPQLKELGYSSTSKYYGISNAGEAEAYMEDSLLRSRLVEISEALLALPSNDAIEIFGYPDNLKLRSCMTLFAETVPGIPVFRKVIEKFYEGKKDPATLELLKK